MDPDSDSDDPMPHKQRKIKPKSHRTDKNDSIPVPSTSTACQNNENDANANNKYDDTFTAFIVEDLHAVSVLSDGGFRKLIRKLHPDCRLPSYDTVLDRIELLYGRRKADLFDKLRDVQYISIGTEQWKSSTDTNYVTIKANFIDNEWMPQSFILTTCPCSLEHNRNDQINDAIRDWDIGGKIVSIVYDTHDTSSIRTTDEDLCHSSTKIICFAKTLQWCIDNGMGSIPEIRDLVTHCKKIVSFFQHSVPADIYLLKYQKLLDIPPNQLIQSTADEINSTYLMLDRLLSQRLAIEAVLADQNTLNVDVKKGLHLSEGEWSTITRVIDVLKPFQLAKEMLFLDRNLEAVTSIVKPVIFSICENFLTINVDDDPAPIHALKKHLKEELQRNFNIHDGSAEIAVPDFQDIATYLDPRYKRQEYLANDRKRENVRKFIRAKCFPSAEPSPVASPSLINRSMKAINLLFPSKLANSTDVETDEWSRYVAEVEINKNLPIHKWWRLNETIYPNVSKMAKLYLCTPARAKSAKSPRHMSRRTLLPPQDIDKFIFLNQNLV